MTSIRKYVGWVIGIGLFIWGTIAAFSIFEQLKFLVDGWSWSVGHIPMLTSVKDVLLLIGKWVSVKVANYRDFVHWVVATLQLPQLPQIVYDIAGVFIFSIRRGHWVGKREIDEAKPRILERIKSLWELDLAKLPPKELKEKLLSVTRGEKLLVRVWYRFGSRTLLKHGPGRPRRWDWIVIVTIVLVYGTAVAIVIAALFGIDYLYRHFA